MSRLASLGLLLIAAVPAYAFEFKDGDRVVLIGSTLIEREQRYGYWEAAITAANPDKTITFRNLGWSGDTVWGEARAGFGTPADGYKHLVDHVRAERPTVIIVGYGTNESFAGPQGLPRFREQLKKLLDDLTRATTVQRFVFLSPMSIQQMPGQRNAAKANDNLKLYAEAIGEEAKARGEFIDMFRLQFRLPLDVIEDGMHLNATGYRGTAGLLARCSPGNYLTGWNVAINGAVRKIRASEKSLKYDPATPLRFSITAAALPIALPDGVPGATQYEGLPNGNYTLFGDGKPLLTAQAKDFGWVRIKSGPEFDQQEQLRQTIIAKNELYFHRWRPQNVTYLFGFRKHEQGNNAREIPQFDPLVEAKEKEIAQLKKPREHVYELVPVKK